MEIGERFAHALAEKDSQGLVDLLDPQVDFRGLTPGRFWEAATAKELVDIFFGDWFEDTDHIDALEGVQTGAVVDRQRVAYQLRVSNDDGVFLVEQQAYFGVQDGRIDWLRVMCSGFRPCPAS